VRTRSLRRLVPAATLALITVAAPAACTAAGAPAAAQPPVATGAPALPPAAAVRPAVADPPAGAVPVAAPLATPPACRGAVVHELDAAGAAASWQPICLTVGGVLRVSNLGPGGFSAAPAGKVACHYAAGVRECRLLHTGTVRFTITDAGQSRTQVVRVVRATDPPRPSPACLPAGTTFTIDAADGGPQGWAACMKLSGTVRVENLGPEGFRVRPAGAVVCAYEAAVRICRFTRPETVTFTTTHGDSEPRSQVIVAIR
jgi:hypothetical protein